LIRRLKGEDLNSLNPRELIPIEEALQNGVTSVRAKQVKWGFLHSFNLKWIRGKRGSSFGFLLTCYYYCCRWNSWRCSS